MSNQPFNIATTILWVQLQKARSFLMFVAGAAIIIAGWIFWKPLIHPYVRIPGNFASLHLDCIAERIQFEIITLNTPVRNSIFLPTFKAGEEAKRVIPVKWPLKWSVNESGAATVVLMSIDPNDPGIQLFKDDLNLSNDFEYNVNFDRRPNIDIQRVFVKAPTQSGKPWCKEEVLEGPALWDKLKRKDARVMRYNLIQEKLSDLVLQLNETVGNIVLAGMVISFCWLLYILTHGLKLLYFTPDASHKDRINARLEQVNAALAQQGAIELIIADFCLLHRRLIFARVLGPAFGFALTVSSLIAALHPAVQAEQDAFRFVSSLQIAMVATLVGLIIRIVAEFSIRVHRASAEYIITLFPSSMNAQSQNDHSSQSAPGGA